MRANSLNLSRLDAAAAAAEANRDGEEDHGGNVDSDEDDDARRAGCEDDGHDADAYVNNVVRLIVIF